jgi:hypothetical protein
MVATWIAETFSAIFQCWPVEYVWDKSIEGGHCVNQNALFQFWSVPNIATDTAMLVLPMPTIWNLQMSKIQKLGLTFTFLLGSMRVTNVSFASPHMRAYSSCDLTKTFPFYLDAPSHRALGARQQH